MNARPDPPDAVPADEAARRARLVDWLQTHGARLDGLAIAQCDGERGVRATVDLAAGSEVARIPPRLFITAHDARRAPRVQRLIAAGRELSDRALLALRLLALRRDGGFWAPYVDSLPRAFPGHPLGWGALELAALDARSALGGVVKSVLETHRADRDAVAELLAAGGFDRADFDWAYTCVRTRAYDIRVAGTPSLALVPLADLLNHVARPATLATRPDDSDYVITATRDIAAGEEVTATYGSYGNVALLATYGFCLPDNPDDTAFVALDDEGFLLTRRYADDGAQRLFASLRRSCGDDEAACLRRLALACETVLLRDVARLSDDPALRADRPEAPGTAALLRAIASEQAVLWHWASLCGTAERVLRDRGSDDRDRALLRWMDADYAAVLFDLITRPQGATT